MTSLNIVRDAVIEALAKRCGTSINNIKLANPLIKNPPKGFGFDEGSLNIFVRNEVKPRVNQYGKDFNFTLRDARVLTDSEQDSGNTLAGYIAGRTK